MDLREVPVGDFERHPWEKARFRFFRRVLETYGRLDRADDVLDVGSGDAWFSSQLRPSLSDEATVTCWDVAYAEPEACAVAEAVHPRAVLSGQRPSGTFDLLLLLDVLEHVEDDHEFLATLVSENLSPGATVLISVPAWSLLMNSHDHGLKHFRRYSPKALANVAASAGLTIVRSGGLFHSLLLPRAMSSVRELLIKTPPTDPGPLTWSHHPWLTSLVDGALSIDNLVSSWAASVDLEIPGLSVWALCRA
jgi:2-polyprenyl-3-methyl-5-hydroxy-6-metoxy-1,4-benzoquinol methylase